ncbi:hypothetical protein [Streptomyces sparsus]
MAVVATPQPLPVEPLPTTSKPATSPAVRSVSAGRSPAKPLRVKPLPAGQPREWYEAHNRRLKALRLATALLATGAYRPAQARNRRIRAIAPLIGVHPPSDTTCRLVRSLLSR